MLCVCRKTCQVKVNGKIIFYNKGQVAAFDECPPYFEPVSGQVENTKSSIDLAVAGREEILVSDATIEDLQKYLLEAYGKTTRSTNRERLVDSILDARMREVSEAIPALGKE